MNPPSRPSAGPVLAIPPLPSGAGRAAVLDATGRPHRLAWAYSRAEMIADGIVHAAGIGFALTAAVVLILLAPPLGRTEFATVMLYAATLVAALAVSAAYNMWPISATKWILRRADHATIFLLIAGTYTPFLVQLGEDRVAAGLLVGIWAIAGLGILLKVFLPGRFDRTVIALYLALGWSGIAAIDKVVAAMPAVTVWLLATGGALYTIGVVFHVWHRLRFQNAIWHAFVLIAASCHYGAVLDSMILSRFG
jgi:hemolysin III